MHRTAVYPVLALLLMSLSGIAQVGACAIQMNGSSAGVETKRVHGCCGVTERKSPATPIAPCQHCVSALPANFLPAANVHHAHQDLAPCAFDCIAGLSLPQHPAAIRTLNESFAAGPPVNLFNSSCLLLI